MIRGLDVTVRVLATTRNATAVSWLVSLLASSNPAVRRRALQGLLERRESAAHLAILQRWHLLDEEELAICKRRSARLSKLMVEALSHSNPRLAANACRAIWDLHDFDRIPTLVRLCADPKNPLAEHASVSVSALAQELHRELTGPRDYAVRRDPALVRRAVMPALEQAVRGYSEEQSELIVEAFLILASPDDSLLQHVLAEPSAPAYEAATRLLLNSDVPGVLDQVFRLLEEPFPPSIVAKVLELRRDPPFLHQLFSRPAESWGAGLRRQISRIADWPWLENDLVTLGRLPDQERAVAVEWMAASALGPERLLDAIRAISRDGGVASRRAAARVASEFSGPQADAILIGAAEDPHPDVQAVAAAQLRKRQLPGALRRLVELLDSPHEVLRNAAAQALRGVTFRRFVHLFGMLDEAARRTLGPFVLRADPNAVAELTEELHSVSRVRRLQALELTNALQAAGQVRERLLEMSHDADHIVRLQCLAVFRDSRLPFALERLQAMQDDPVASVREAAREAVASAAVVNSAGVPRPVFELPRGVWPPILAGTAETGGS